MSTKQDLNIDELVAREFRHSAQVKNTLDNLEQRFNTVADTSEHNVSSPTTPKL